MENKLAVKQEWDNTGAGQNQGRQSTGGAEQLASLTPLRGVAACWVMVTHFANSLAMHHGRFTGAVSKGHLAVDLFFVLSGFVITHVYKRGFVSGVTPGRYWSFLKARVARLYPLHIAVLLLFVAAVIVEGIATYVLDGSFHPIPLAGERSLIGLPANLLMLQGLWTDQLIWNPPTWSISIEFLAYLLFPLFCAVLCRTSPLGKAAIGCGILGVLSWLAYYTGGDFNQHSGVNAMVRGLPEFAAGALLYSVYETGPSATVLATDSPILVVLLVLGALSHFAAPDLSIVVLFPLLILTAVCNRGRLARVFNSRPFVWLGDISYSVYLVHWLVLFVVSEAVEQMLGFIPADLPVVPSLLLMAAMIGVSFGLATLSYRFVEIPGRRWLRERLDVAWGHGVAMHAGLASSSRA